MIFFSLAPWLPYQDFSVELEGTTCTCPILRVIYFQLFQPCSLRTLLFSTPRRFCRRGFKYFLSLSDLAKRYWVKKCKLHNAAWAKQVSTNKHRTQTAEWHPLTSAVSGGNFAILKLLIRVFQLRNKIKATNWCGHLQIKLCTWVFINYVRDALPLFIKLLY